MLRSLPAPNAINAEKESRCATPQLEREITRSAGAREKYVRAEIGAEHENVEPATLV